MNEVYPNLCLLSLLLIYDRAGEHNFDPELFLHYYAFKLLSLLGYRPGLKHCLVCTGKLNGEKFYFDPKQGGVVCPGCSTKKSRFSLTISEKCVNILRFLTEHNLESAVKLKFENTIKTEIKRTVRSFTSYNLNLNF